MTPHRESQMRVRERAGRTRRLAAAATAVALAAGTVGVLSAGPAFANASVTKATGGSSISADTAGGTYTALTGPTITENADGDIGTGQLTLKPPSGFEFRTSVNVTATIGDGN